MIRVTEKCINNFIEFFIIGLLIICSLVFGALWESRRWEDKFAQLNYNTTNDAELWNLLRAWKRYAYDTREQRPETAAILLKQIYDYLETIKGM